MYNLLNIIPVIQQMFQVLWLLVVTDSYGLLWEFIRIRANFYFTPKNEKS